MNKLLSDLSASIVVFLIAVPLSMGIAIASGVSPAQGLITAIVGGIVVGLLAGCPLQVSGPAAGLTVIVYEIVVTYGLQNLGIIVFLAGVVQILAAALKLGQWFRASSPAVIHGMLSGIGVLIMASQTHVMVDDLPRKSGLHNIISIPEAIWKGIPTDGSTHHKAAFIGLLAIAIMIAWAYVPKKLKLIPAPLVAVIICTAVANIFAFPIKYINVPDNIFSEVIFPSMSQQWTSLIVPVMTIAVVASAETMLTSVAVDQMTLSTTKHNKELFSQGVGNAICGLLGALPMTGVIVRSTANINAGAKTRLSTILHGTWILIFVMLFPSVLKLIPTTCLAAILVFTGFKLTFSGAYQKLKPFGRSEAGIYLATIVAIVATDLLTGVIIGFALTVYKLLYTFSHIQIAVEKKSDSVYVVRLDGAATFLCIPKLAAVLESLPVGEIHIQVERLSFIDHACLDMLSNFQKLYEAKGGTMYLELEQLHMTYHSARPSTRKAATPTADVEVPSPS
ncbi:MAG: SulP family inorganic anion transporter [Acidobacteriota bacterium]|nr:SulP family inorganic anion transporter [Blastocatellia bacterium]MDW8411132.1 SulP family inorganic anion transporter [Acidobacteriota bacterium]